MKIDGINTKNYGLVPLRVNGHLNMPSRLAPYSYDWGDEIEPILTPSLMAWESRNIIVEFLYDERVATSANRATPNFLDVLTRNFALSEVLSLEVTEALGTVGVYAVTLASVTDHIRYKDVSKITFIFSEQVPSFNGALPSILGPSNLTSLGGYRLSQFGIGVFKINGLSGLGDQKNKSVTVYLKSPERSAYRSLQSVVVQCYMVGSNAQDLLIQMAAFQKVLIKPELLRFKHGSFDFNTFAATGFSASKVGKRTAKFDLTLFRYEDI